ncbi:hypothetical protein [Mesorhizobium sp. LNHC221B00]|uniref:hypothetical protein n=1 Tax=Mesorhizobium sp. LNHC221B00 TaxID=1287233 RepID=UPI0018DD60CF|nr:hypothetical protein [Mesorhizobium sp. LNHC221B00]
MVIEEFERRITLPNWDICDKLQTALENTGAAFIAENGGGIGVRLKLNRSEVRRIDVLENEGGIVGIDAVPLAQLLRSEIDLHEPSVCDQGDPISGYDRQRTVPFAGESLHPRREERQRALPRLQA